MITQELLNFIKQNISQGKSKEEVKRTLISGGGWKESDIEEAFRLLGINVQSPIPISPQIPIVLVNKKEDSSNLGSKIFYFIYYSVVMGAVIFLLIGGAMFFISSSKELGLALFPILFFFLPPILSLIISIVVYRDAKKLKSQGADINSPILWALVSYVLVGFAVYLSLRRVDFKRQIKNT